MRTFFKIFVPAFITWSLFFVGGYFYFQSPAGATSTTGPCQVGVELRGFPKPNFTRLVGYTSYLCPDGATSINVTYQLVGTKPGGAKVNLGPFQIANAPNLNADEPGVAGAYSMPVQAGWKTTYSAFQVRTTSTYYVGSQGYTQSVISDKGTVSR